MSGYTIAAQFRAHRMRLAPTTAEAAVWEIVRGKRLGARFRRQQPIGPFIADFVCIERKLVVEIDGPQHGDEPTIDARRTAWLEAKGYRVIRFTNAEVKEDVMGVAKRIAREVDGPHPPASPAPSPSRGEG